MTIGSIMGHHKKRVITTAAIALFMLAGTTLGMAFPATALAWDNCPKGLVNDPYPGACRRYVDTNADGICDLSQPKPAATTTTTEVITTTTAAPPATTAVTKETTTTVSPVVTTPVAGDPPTGDCPLGPCLGCGACATFSLTGTIDYTDVAPAGAAGAVLLASNDTDLTSGSDGSGGTAAVTSDAADGSGDAAAATGAAAAATDSGGVPFLTHYLVSPIALGFFLIYAVSFVLYKTKRIRIATHRKIWNVLLMVTFLVTGIFGVILAIQLDYPLSFNIPINLLFWHVEAGIVMTLISLFHMGWHFNYYRNCFRKSRTKVRAARAAERQALAGERALAAQARDQRRAERDARRAERETKRADRERLAWQAAQATAPQSAAGRPAPAGPAAAWQAPTWQAAPAGPAAAWHVAPTRPTATVRPGPTAQAQPEA